MADELRAGDASVVVRDPIERRFRQLLEHSPYPMCVHADGRVVYVNPAGVASMAAKSADDLVGKMITDFVHPDSVVSMLTRIAALEEEGDSSPAAEAVMLRLDGTSVDAEIVSVLTSWDGKPAYQVVFRDLTIEKAAEATLRLQAALVTHASDAIIATTTTGTVTSWNRAAENIYQRSAKFAVGSQIDVVVGAAVDPARIVAAGGAEQALHRAADGAVLSVRVAAAAMDDGYVYVCSDLTALHRAERRVQTVVDSLDEGVVILDARGESEWINPAARRILGLPVDGALPQKAGVCDVDGNPLGDGRQLVSKILTTGAVLRDHIVGFERPGQARRWLSFSARRFDPAESGQQAVLASFTDVTEQHQTRLQLNYQAHHDSLTGLPNRAHADAWAARAMHTEPMTLTAVMFIDLDYVKNVNDQYGHHAGDAVIKVAAQRLRATLRADDFIARHGGDEFVVLLFGRGDRTALEQLSDRLHSAVAMPMDVDGATYSITASIGVAEVRPGDVRDAAQILRDADAAMYKAKMIRGATHYAENAPDF